MWEVEQENNEYKIIIIKYRKDLNNVINSYIIYLKNKPLYEQKYIISLEENIFDEYIKNDKFIYINYENNQHYREEIYKVEELNINKFFVKKILKIINKFIKNDYVILDTKKLINRFNLIKKMKKNEIESWKKYYDKYCEIINYFNVKNIAYSFEFVSNNNIITNNDKLEFIITLKLNDYKIFLWEITNFVVEKYLNSIEIMKIANFIQIDLDELYKFLYINSCWKWSKFEIDNKKINKTLNSQITFFKLKNQFNNYFNFLNKYLYKELAKYLVSGTYINNWKEIIKFYLENFSMISQNEKDKIYPITFNNEIIRKNKFQWLYNTNELSNDEIKLIKEFQFFLFEFEVIILKEKQYILNYYYNSYKKWTKDIKGWKIYKKSIRDFILINNFLSAEIFWMIQQNEINMSQNEEINNDNYKKFKYSLEVFQWNIRQFIINNKFLKPLIKSNLEYILKKENGRYEKSKNKINLINIFISVKNENNFNNKLDLSRQINSNTFGSESRNIKKSIEVKKDTLKNKLFPFLWMKYENFWRHTELLKFFRYEKFEFFYFSINFWHDLLNKANHLPDLENNLIDLYNKIKDGTIKTHLNCDLFKYTKHLISLNEESEKNFILYVKDFLWILLNYKINKNIVLFFNLIYSYTIGNIKTQDFFELLPCCLEEYFLFFWEGNEKVVYEEYKKFKK